MGLLSQKREEKEELEREIPVWGKEFEGIY